MSSELERRDWWKTRNTSFGIVGYQCEIWSRTLSANRGTVSNIHQDGMCVVLLYLLQLQVRDSRGDETDAVLKADNLQVDKMFGVF
jgi:hypothetical protein